MHLGFNWPIQRTEDQKKKIIAKNKKRRVKFDPNRDFIENAVEEYLKNGGEITKVEFNPDVYGFLDTNAVDEFLMDQ